MMMSSNVQIPPFLLKQAKLLPLLQVTCHCSQSIAMYLSLAFDHCYYLVSHKYPLASVHHWITQINEKLLKFIEKESQTAIRKSTKVIQTAQNLEDLTVIVTHRVIRDEGVLLQKLLCVSCLYLSKLMECFRQHSKDIIAFVDKVFHQIKSVENCITTYDRARLPEELTCHIPVSLFEECKTPDSHVQYDVKSLLAFMTGLAHLATGDVNAATSSWTDYITDPCLDAYAKYLRGCYFMKLGFIDESLDSIQAMETTVLSQLPTYIQVYLLNLKATCLSEKGKVHSAITLYRECIKTDPEYLWSLYNLSKQYRKLGNEEGEIQVLKLLIKARRKAKADSESHDPFTECAQNYFGHQAGNPPVSLCLYAIARRHNDLGRYDEASLWYLDLLSEIRENPNDLSLNACQACNIPSITTIYMEAASCLFSSGKYRDSLVVCDLLIANEHISTKADERCNSIQTNGNLPKGRTGSDVCLPHGDVEHWSLNERAQSQIQVEQKSGMSNKRRRSVSEECGSLTLDIFSQAMLCKSECLYSMGDCSTALECVTQLLTKSAGCFPEHTSGEGTTLQKRHKMDSDDLNDGYLLEENLSSAYTIQAVIHEDMGKVKEAVQSYRAALLHSTKGETAKFNLSLALFGAGKMQDAVSVWLPHRGLLPNMDQFQTEALIARKKKLLYECGGEENMKLKPHLPSTSVNKTEALVMDVKVLNGFLEHRTKTNTKCFH